MSETCPDCGNPPERSGIVITGGGILSGPLGDPCDDYFHPANRPTWCVHVPLGWRCRLGYHEDGPCAALPSWWNVRARWRFRGMRKYT